jgi:two-component system, cell cycle response regulator
MLAQRTAESLERWNNRSDNRIPVQYVESPQSCRVLVVDDDDVARTCLSALLKRAHYDVIVAASGEEALRLMSATHCDIVLTDWQMPNMDGISLCRHVRLEYQDDRIYVLLLTVRDTREDRLAGLAAGADDYIIKGGPINDILERLNAGRCITQARLSLRNGNRQPRRPSTSDPLTNARNLRFFTQQLPRAIAAARRGRRALAVLSCRIDGFEQANDRFGDGVGDEALRAFVADSRSCMRKNSDWLARVGTDRFMIVLPETRFKGAARVAGKLRQIFAAVPVSTPLGPIGFTVSIAVTSCEPKHSMASLPQMWDLLLSTDGGVLH